VALCPPWGRFGRPRRFGRVWPPYSPSSTHAMVLVGRKLNAPTSDQRALDSATGRAGMNPREEKAANRIRELISEGEAVAQLERPSQHVGPYIQDKVPLHAWLVKVENIVKTTFGTDSAHYAQLAPVLKGHASHAYEVRQIVGILTGALDDLEGGYLRGQEHLIAGEILDSVLGDARQLSKAGFKDPAAVLVRVVVEDALRRMCREAGLPDNAKAAILNDSLRDAGQYAKSQWRIIQSWLDVGNAAAHGDFEDYTSDDVDRMITDVERFLAERLLV
jgi:hypothetical protein